ncbi:MAG: hypothetical protein LBJ84_04420 [Oscillospiraceae bacterium]|nr:hypothetical protein [Oscillospiraceae bacterium]
MLGTSGSGKTVYMDAMSELFYHGSVNGFSISNRDDSYQNNTFVYKAFSGINTLSKHGRFPNGSSSNVIMPLKLKYKGTPLIDIDWIDYRGGAITELALGEHNSQNSKVLATLITSDVVMIFVDAAVLKVCTSVPVARANVGANEIIQLLRLIRNKKCFDIVFILSKMDSSIVNMRTEYSQLKDRLSAVYARYFADTNTNITQYPVIPVGSVGIGNVETTYKYEPNREGGNTLVFNHEIIEANGINPINIAASFAHALLKCMEMETESIKRMLMEKENELTYLMHRSNSVSEIMDIMFSGGQGRWHIQELRNKLSESRNEINKLIAYKPQLKMIASSEM